MKIDFIEMRQSGKHQASSEQCSSKYVRGGQQLLLEKPHCHCHTDSVTTTATGGATLFPFATLLLPQHCYWRSHTKKTQNSRNSIYVKHGQQLLLQKSGHIATATTTAHFYIKTLHQFHICTFALIQFHLTLQKLTYRTYSKYLQIYIYLVPIFTAVLVGLSLFKISNTGKTCHCCQTFLVCPFLLMVIIIINASYASTSVACS